MCRHYAEVNSRRKHSSAVLSFCEASIGLPKFDFSSVTLIGKIYAYTTFSCLKCIDQIEPTIPRDVSERGVYWGHNHCMDLCWILKCTITSASCNCKVVHCNVTSLRSTN